MKPRQGHSLIELLAVLTVGSTVMMVTVGVLHLMFRAEQTCRQRQNDLRVVANLTEQFRQDVHAATRFSVDPWDFELAPDHGVSYRRDPGALVRTETVAGRLRKHEQYPIPAAVRVSIRADSSPPKMIALVLAPEPGKPLEPAWKEIRIEAGLGMDRRFPGGATAGGETP